MLTLTTEAAIAIRELVVDPEVSDDAGLRITWTTTNDGSSELAASVAARPEPSDETIENDGARVYMDPQTASLLTNQMLDADASEHGQVRFELMPQIGA